MFPVLIADIDDRRFGFRVEDVHEVVRAVAVTALPGAPPVVEGVIDYRQTTLPVLNLRRRFGYPPRALNLTDRFVIATAGGRKVALRVDAVQDVTSLDQESVESAEGLWALGGLVAGVVRLEEDLVLIAEMESFLSHTETAALEEALSAPREAE